MATLQQDILLDSTALATAVTSMSELSGKVQQLKEDLETLYDGLASALQTPAGEAMDLKAKDILVKPIDDLKLIVDHISDTLNDITGTDYYQNVFDKYSELNQNIQVN